MGLRSIFTTWCLVFFCLVPMGLSQEANALAEAGIPSLGSKWKGADYIRASDILGSGKIPLPRLNSEGGKAFLQRLTARENLAVLGDRTLPLAVRVEESFAMGDGAKKILKQYLAAAAKDGSLHSELAQQMCFMLHAAEGTLKLAEEFLPTIPKDEKYAVRMEGVRQMNLGMSQAFAGAEVSLSDRGLYEANDFTLLIESMAEVLPNFKKAFSVDFSTALRRKFEADKKRFQGRDAELIQKMIDELGR